MSELTHADEVELARQADQERGYLELSREQRSDRMRRFTTLDSGERVDFPSGMRRDTDKGKARFDLIPLPMLRRLADLYARGSVKYGDRNWELADSQTEVDRFKASAFRHFVQWLEGDRTEDHAIATVFNVFAAETIAAKINEDRERRMDEGYAQLEKELRAD